MTADTEREAPPIDEQIARQTMEHRPRTKLADVLRILNERCPRCGQWLTDEARCLNCGRHSE